MCVALVGLFWGVDVPLKTYYQTIFKRTHLKLNLKRYKWFLKDNGFYLSLYWFEIDNLAFLLKWSVCVPACNEVVACRNWMNQDEVCKSDACTKQGKTMHKQDEHTHASKIHSQPVVWGSFYRMTKLQWIFMYAQYFK